MANTSYFDLYKALKADGAVQGDWNSFHKFVGAQGKQGYLNRKKLYDALKADGAVQANTYEEFNNTLFRGGQASLKAAKQRQQTQGSTRTQAHARYNNGAASQQPQTAAQRALQMVAPTQQEQSQIPSKASPFVRSLYRQQEMNERDAAQMDYSSPNAVKQLDSSRRRNQKISNQIAVYSSANGERIRREQPIVDTGSPEANKSIVKTQGQLEDEMNASSQQFVDNNMGSYIDQAVSQEFEDAHKRGLQALGNDYFTHGTGGADWFVGEKKYQQQLDPDTMIKSLSGKVGAMVQSPDFIKQVESEATRLGVDPTEYAQNSVAPKLMDKISSKLMDEDVMRRMPKGTLEYIAGGILNSMTGALLTGLTTSKQQRQNQQQADAKTREGENPNYQPGTWANAARGTVSFLADAPAFGAAGKVGAKVAGKAFGEGQALAARLANMSKAERIITMGAQGATSGGVTGFLYGAVNAPVQNLSTGEDTSLGNTLKLALQGGTSEAASFALMSGLGGAVGGFGHGIGINGMEASRGELLKHGAQKLGFEGVKTITEGLGMWAGGNLARAIEGEKQDWSIAGGLESVASAAIFKLMHAKEVGRRDPQSNGFWNSVSTNIKRYFISDKAKTQRFALTNDEKDELANAGVWKGKNEPITVWANRIGRSKNVDADTQDVATTYDAIMKDPTVSWDAKAKFSTLVMGVVPSSRPQHDHYGFSIETVNGKTNKYVNSFAKDGTLLSKASYDKAGQRNNIMYENAVNSENIKLKNAYALAVGSASDERMMQSRFLLDSGYKQADPHTQEQMLADMANKGSDLYRNFLNWCTKQADTPIGRAVAKVSEATGMSAEGIMKAFNKDPMKRSDAEQNVSVIFRRALTSEVFPESKPHPEQSSEDGKDVVTDNNLGTDQPNGEAVVTELRNLKQAEAEMEQLMNDNDIFSDNFKGLQQQGLTHPQIYDWMIQNGMTEEQLLPYAKYMNQVAKVQGMQDATAKAIEENVGAFVQDWTFHGTMDGQKMNGEQALWVQDNTGRTLLVGSGDVAYDPTNGKPKDGVGDMLVCLDPNTGETVYIKVEDTTLFQNQSAADLEAYRRQQLQQINSAPYNQAAQEQAMVDAANPQPKQEEKPAETVTNGNGLEQPQQGNVEIPQQNYTLSEKKSGNGEQFYQDESGSIDLANIPDEVFDSIGYTKAPFRLTPSMIRHMLDRHNKELKFKDENEAIHFVRDVMTNFDHVRLGTDGALVFSIENGRNRTGKRAITILINTDNGQFYGLKTSGYEGIKGLERRPLLWERGANKDSSSTDAASAIVPTSKSSVSGEQSGSASNQSIGLVGKDTNNSLNNNEVNTTLTFKDGSPVPVDANGEPDFMQMSPEQGAELYADSFNDPDAQVAKDVKAAEKALKDARKMEPKGKTFNEKKKSQQVINETIKKAEEQLRVVREIQKAMTAKKVAETVGKPEGETVQNTDGMDEATKNFVEAPKVEGRKGTITLPNGEEISGTYYAVPAMSLIPSHDPFNGYKPHAGVPLDENGHTINDRDYYSDKGAQDTTNAAGNDYDGRAISDVPVVNPDGRVLSGNGRTMAGQLAAANGKDAKYAESRDKNAAGFGMKAEELDKLDHARIIFVPDEPLPYTTDTFAKFNRNEKKTQSNTEQAVAKAKQLSPDEVGAIIADIEGNGSLEAFFNNPNAINSLIKTLQEKGIIGQNEVAELMEGTDKLSPQGKEMVKNLLLGSIFKPETIRMLGVDSAIKNKAIAGIRAVMDNLKLGDYSLRDEIDSAIQLLYEARTGGDKVDTLLRTPEMFGESAAERYPSISQMMALALEGKASDFRDLLNEYNREASARNTGEGNVFGDTPTKEELIRDFLKYKEWKDYETRGNSEAERGNDAEGVRETEPEAQGGNDGGKPESKPSGEPAKPEDGVKAEEADDKKDTTKNGENIPQSGENHTTDAENHTTSATNPVKTIEDAATSYKQEQIAKAAEAYKVAKESGDEEATTKAAKTLKHLMDENLKEKGYNLNQRQAAIALQVGKKEAETIDKPLNEMDSEELEFVASKNPLTESEIRELAPAEDKNFIEDAVDYVNGNHGFAQKLAYLKIYKDVRSRYENAPDNSGAKDGTQLAPADNGSGEGLGLGTGRDSGGPAGQVDRGTGNEPAPGERRSGESGENDPHLPAGEQSDKQGEGTAPGVGDVPARGTESEGGSEPSGNGNVPERGGQDGGRRPAEKNARRKPTAKQGTTWRGRSGEEIKKNVEDKKAAALAAIAQLKKLKYGKGGSGNLGSMELMTPEQMEYLPTVANAIKDYGMAIIDQGIYKVKDWLSNVRDTFMDALKDSGFTETEVDRFIKEMWNSKMTMDGETHTIEDWCSIYGQSQLRKKLNETLDEKRQRQMDAEPIKVKVGDRKNIEETLPYLLPEQQEDVYRAETQFFGKEHSDREHAYGKGYMFTNGTGTGKTYTGLGIAKRLVKQGKKRILFVTPSDKKVKDWIKDGKNLGLDIRSLDDWAKERGTTATTENGDGCVITTFANFGVNKKLLEAEWDAVIYDESHRIMENKKGTETSRSMQHYKVSNRDESHCFLRLQDINPHYQKMQKAAEKFAEQHEKERKRIISEYKKAHPSATTKEIINATHKMMPKDINGFAPADGQTFPKLGKLYNDFKEAQAYYYNKVKPSLEKQAKDTWKNTKTIFLSATPFNTRENLDYAEEYIFKYPESDDSGMPGRTRFYLDHFGAAYKFRYNRLEQSISNPEAVAKQEVAFSDYLQNNLGTMSGRIIDSPYDYSRDFPTVAPDHADAFNDAVQGCLHTKHLYSAYLKTIGDYNYGSALFETMKVANSINRIKEHLAAGRKVVIYHRRVETKEPIRPPFEYMLDVANQMIKQMAPGKERDEFIAEANEFREKHQDLLQWEQTLDYSMPREQIAKVFGNDNVLFFSGKESKKVKDAAVDTFNDDNSGKNILVIQEASGKEGISLHDTTGKHQRVVITLALPQSPITALQIEGRIYRIGNMSNAIFEYPILGLNSEMMLFGQKFNNQVSTTENLALGSQARNLRDSFAKGILEHSGIVPIDQQGVGGKAFDAPKQDGDSDPFDDAVLDYYSNQKLNKKNREGVDYFPTPEPLGYKMVQWAGLQEGDSVLEPSAGHGAIARYVPQSNELVNIEPSQNLFSRLQLKVGGFGRKFLNNTFENYDIHNKHDAIVMNPPFGKAGATAIQHLDKAFKHLDEGGRIVAILPMGSAFDKFSKWKNANKDAVEREMIQLPSITFQQAGTSVNAFVTIIDKVSNPEMREKAGRTIVHNLISNYDKIEDFFEDLRNMEAPDRIIDTNFKVQKKSRQTVKDIKDIKGVRSVDMDKHGINVKLKGNWMEYAFSFEGSEKPDFFKKKMANYYQQYKEFEKDTWRDEEKAVFNEFQKLACKLAGMTEEEMQRFIKNGDSNGTTHFREDRGIQYSKTDAKDVKNSRIIPEDVDKSVSSQIEKKFDETINDISSSAEERFKEKAQDIINHATAEYSNETREVLEYEKTDYENEIAKLHRGTSIGGVRSAGGSSQNTGSYRLSVARANIAAIDRELAYRDARAKVIRDNYGLPGGGDKITSDLVERIFKEGNPSKEQSELFTKAYSITKRLGVEFRMEAGTDNRASGEADVNRNINLFLDGLVKTRSAKDSMPRVLLHEMLHQATMGAINLVKSGKAEGMLTPKQIEGVKTILDLYDKVKDDKERFKEEPYGLQNEYEFAAQMADPRQRKALDLDIWDRVKNAAKELANKGDRSMWQTFKDAVKKLFEVSDKDKMDKALNDIMDDFNEKIDDLSMNDIDKDGFAYKVEDKDELDSLEKDKTFKMYSALQEVDGQYASPMAGYDGETKKDMKLTNVVEPNKWYGADELDMNTISDEQWRKIDELNKSDKAGDITLIPKKLRYHKGSKNGNGALQFWLQKTPNSGLWANYNPYNHTSTSMMNDQFTGAYGRSVDGNNLVTVEWDIPESEKTSGYQAEMAHDPEGFRPWHSGVVNSLLPENRQRGVMLSRHRRMSRVVPMEEVAKNIAAQMKGSGLAIPWNTMPKQLLEEVAKQGVPITTVAAGAVKPKYREAFEQQMAEIKEKYPQARFVDVEMTQAAFKEWGKNGGTHFREDRSSEDLYNSLKDKRNNRKEYNGTVTELANRVKQGTARIVREGKEDESGRTINRRESLPAIAGQILLSENQQGNGQAGGRIGEASRAKGEKVLQNNAIYGQIEEWAKENGYHFTESDIAKESLDGDVWKNGWEANVYRSKDDKSVIKVMPLDNLRDNPIAYSLDRNRYFNEVFPDTAIEVIGYGKDNNGDASVIFKQPLVDGKTVLEYFNGDKEAANDYIDKFLEDMGYSQKVEHDEWGGMANTNGKYTIFDVNDGNIIIDKDGKPHVIDAEVLPVDYKNDGKIEIKDSESTHFRTDDAVRIADDAPVVVKHVDKIAKQVGGKVKMIQSVDEITDKSAKEAIEAGRNITGWYDEKTGEVHLYMPSIHDRYTAEKTIWHEVVGHKGMRKLIGDDNYSDFLRSLWYDLDRPENARLKELVSEELKYNPFNFENAIEEGIARLVEDGKGEPGFWNNIKNKVTDLLHEIGYRVAPNTKDVKYLLWLAKNKQKHPNDMVWKMRAEAVRWKLAKEDVPAMIEKDGVFYGQDGKGHSFNELTKKDFEEATDGEIHYRTTPSAATALDRYHKSLDAHGYMFTESYMDNMLSLKNLMQAIVPDNKNIADIKSSENPYILQNTMQGAMSNASQMFERNVMKPLDKAMAHLLDAFDGKKDKDKIKNFNLYMITKHGLERNRVLFVRDYINTLEKEEADILRQQWNTEKKDLGDKLRNGTIRLDKYYEDMDEWIRNNVDTTFKADEHDYSGIHAIQGVEKDSAPYNDADAIASVMDSEANMESIKKGSVNDFWDKVKAATQYSLDCDYKNGLMDKELHSHVSDMFDWYVPLRKYDEKTAEDTYGYITEKGDPRNFIGRTIMRAKGRTSLSETNVLAMIGAMGNRAINNGGQNAIKQAFARFIRSHSNNNLVTETSVWYVDDPNTMTTTERYPDIPEDATPDEINRIVSDFNRLMLDLQSKGLARKVRRNDKIGYRFQKAENKSQHLVDVMIAGKKHTFVINGNPRAAQALNGLLENSGAKGIMKPLGSISRMMAQLCTSFNPEFVMRNIMRDAEFASSNVTAKEGARYGGIWAKYYAQLGLYKGASSISLKDFSGNTGLGLFAKYRNGTLDMSDKVQRYFKEFMENGGETGWVQIKNMKEWEKQYKADVKSERSKVQKNGKMVRNFFFGNLENLNEVAENIARFSTYCASRDYGRSIVRSTYDAKEVSTNFNRHGSGDAIKSFKNGEMGTGKAVERWAYGFTSSYLRHCSMFFNAGIQSTNLLVKNLKTNPVGTSVNMLSIPFALGALGALLNNALIASEDEKDRKGVKDPYGELPDYIRRNNLCIYKGGGEFITIPLAIELRAFYGLGDLAAGLTFSPNVSGQKNPFFDAVGSMSQLVPVMDYLGNSSAGKDPIGETIKAISPSAISPFVEWEMNSDWKGSPIERRGDYNKDAPAWQRAYNGTPGFLKDINKYVNAATNDVADGNEDMLGNGFLDMVTNPSMVNHYLGGIGGGAATFGERLIGAIKNGKDTETKDIPFVRSLLYTPSEQTSLQRTKSKWYNYKDELETTMANVDRLKAKNVPIDKRLQNMADYYHFQNSSDAAKVRIIDLAEKQMKQWKKMRDRATDTQSVNFANQNIDRIMMEAVEELDRME